jgi:hypothetical protein
MFEARIKELDEKLLAQESQVRCRNDDAKAQVSNANGASLIVGFGGMLPQKIVECRVSETPFHALCGKILSNSDGEKTTYFISD